MEEVVDVSVMHHVAFGLTFTGLLELLLVGFCLIFDDDGGGVEKEMSDHSGNPVFFVVRFRTKTMGGRVEVPRHTVGGR